MKIHRSHITQYGFCGIHFQWCLPSMLSKMGQFCSKLHFLFIVCPERGEGYKGWDRPQHLRGERYGSLKIQAKPLSFYDNSEVSSGRWRVGWSHWWCFYFDSIQWWLHFLTLVKAMEASLDLCINITITIYEYNFRTSLHGPQNPQWFWKAFTSNSFSKGTLLLKLFWW